MKQLHPRRAAIRFRASITFSPCSSLSWAGVLAGLHRVLLRRLAPVAGAHQPRGDDRGNHFTDQSAGGHSRIFEKSPEHQGKLSPATQFQWCSIYCLAWYAFTSCVRLFITVKLPLLFAVTLK